MNKLEHGSQKKYFHGLLRIDLYLYIVDRANSDSTTLTFALNEIIEEHRKSNQLPSLDHHTE